MPNEKISLFFKHRITPKNVLIKVEKIGEEKNIIKNKYYVSKDNPKLLIIEPDPFYPEGYKINIGVEVKPNYVLHKKIKTDYLIKYNINKTPQIIETSPSNDEEDISTSALINIHFDEFVKSEGSKNLFLINNDNGKTVPGQIEWQNNNTVAVLKPFQNLQCEQKYAILVKPGIENTARGYIFQNHRFFFTTEKCPYILKTAPENKSKNIKTAANILISFNEPIKQESESFIHLRDINNNNVSFIADWQNYNQTVELQPKKPLELGTQYKVSISNNFVSEKGNLLKNGYEFFFATEYIPSSINLNVSGYEGFQKVMDTISRGKVKLSSIGKSVENRDILATSFGEGSKKILIVGGHHGYESMSVILPLYFINYLAREELIIPPDVEILVIPLLNPDGFNKHIRTNANGVDLNRNYGHSNWNTVGVDRGIFFAGSEPFSESETQVMKKIIEENKFSLVISYHSNKGYVLSNSYLDKFEGLNLLTRKIGEATEYFFIDISKIDEAMVESSGDFIDWIGEKHSMPGITIELKTESSVQCWERNKKILPLIIEWLKS